MVFEVRTAEVVQHYLPEIAKQLKRIADALEEKNKENKEDKG
jgi:hypothetical protein